MRKIAWWKQIISQILLIAAGIYVLIPIWGIFRLAFDGTLRGRATEFRWLPKLFSLDGMLRVLDKPYQSVDFITLLQNSLITSLGATVLTLILGMSLAYAFARYRFPGRRAGLFFLLLAALLPPIAFATPLYIVLSFLKIRTTILGLTLVYTVFAMPFCIWNMRAAFQSITRELEEAAFLDGAGSLGTFWWVTLPLALPSIAIAALIAFLTGYSEFAIGWLFVDKASNVTLAMAIYAIVQTGNAQSWNILGSFVLIMSLPVIIIFFILQRVLLERWLYGSISE